MGNLGKYQVCKDIDVGDPIARHDISIELPVIITLGKARYKILIMATSDIRFMEGRTNMLKQSLMATCVCSQKVYYTDHIGNA